jgi:RHH-type proline utilization regulon transcriptional repressor/proline dehydrogenase/delta 1-pyrroline-5-carboxylate dehydrogenase
LVQIAAAWATGNQAALLRHETVLKLRLELPQPLRQQIDIVDTLAEGMPASITIAGVLLDDAGKTGLVKRHFAAQHGARIAVVLCTAAGCALERLVTERVVTINTAAAGGNATLMSLQAD